MSKSFGIGLGLLAAASALGCADDSGSGSPTGMVMPPTGVAMPGINAGGAAAPGLVTPGMTGVAGVAGMMGLPMAGGTMVGLPIGGSPAGGCGDASPDSDGDGMPDCRDMCPMDRAKSAPGVCGCGRADADTNNNGTPDCNDADPPMEPDAPDPSDPNLCAVQPIPDALRSEYRIGAFYTRYADAMGTPVTASDSPVDEAISRACRVVIEFSRLREDLRATMKAGKIRFIMMAADEKTVDTPEFRSLGDIDGRARGLGSVPASLCAEENVMCESSDRWRGESICIHEYSHGMQLGVYNKADPMFQSKLNAAFQAAKSKGLFANTYAGSQAAEYFAEGVQDWYNTNLFSRRGDADGVHNQINTKDELKEYDPALYELLGTVLPAEPMFKDCYWYEK